MVLGQSVVTKRRGAAGLAGEGMEPLFVDVERFQEEGREVPVLAHVAGDHRREPMLLVDSDLRLARLVVPACGRRHRRRSSGRGSPRLISRWMLLACSRITSPSW